MRPRLQCSLHPGMQCAAQIQPSQLFMLLESQHLRGLHLMPHFLQAPPPHPPPFPPSPAVTQVPEEGWVEAYRAGATALSACWRPLVVHLRTTMMLMGLAGPELWRTSTLSIKGPRAGPVMCFLAGRDAESWRLLGGALLMMKAVQITGSHIILFVCFCFTAISCFCNLTREGMRMLSSMPMPISPFCLCGFL